MDCGLIQEKARDSLAKFPGRTGTKGSGSSDRDLTARIITVQDLIVSVGCGSGGQGSSERGSAARLAGDRAPVAGCCRSWPNSVLWAGIRAGKGPGRLREAQCGTRNPPGVTAGLAGARSSGHSYGGGSAAVGSPASTFARSSRHGNWAKGRVRMCNARVTRNRVGVVLCTAAGAWPRWSSGGGAPVFAFWLQG